LWKSLSNDLEREASVLDLRSLDAKS